MIGVILKSSPGFVTTKASVSMFVVLMVVVLSFVAVADGSRHCSTYTSPRANVAATPAESISASEILTDIAPLAAG